MLTYKFQMKKITSIHQPTRIRFTILAAVEGMTTPKRNGVYLNETNFNGVYKTEAITPGIAVYYNF